MYIYILYLFAIFHFIVYIGTIWDYITIYHVITLNMAIKLYYYKCSSSWKNTIFKQDSLSHNYPPRVIHIDSQRHLASSEDTSCDKGHWWWKQRRCESKFIRWLTKNHVLTCKCHICLNFMFDSGDVFYVKDHLALENITGDGESLAKVLSSFEGDCDSGENPRLLHYLYPDKPFPSHLGKLFSVVYFPEFHFTLCPLFYVNMICWLLLLILIYLASVAGEETLHTYSYVQSHIKDTWWRIKTW